MAFTPLIAYWGCVSLYTYLTAHTCTNSIWQYIRLALQITNYLALVLSETYFPPTTTYPNVGSGKEIPEGGKGESERRGCQLPELREWGFVTAGLWLQLVCCT